MLGGPGAALPASCAVHLLLPVGPLGCLPGHIEPSLACCAALRSLRYRRAACRGTTATPTTSWLTPTRSGPQTRCWRQRRRPRAPAARASPSSACAAATGAVQQKRQSGCAGRLCWRTGLWLGSGMRAALRLPGTLSTHGARFAALPPMPSTQHPLNPPPTTAAAANSLLSAPQVLQLRQLRPHDAGVLEGAQPGAGGGEQEARGAELAPR